MKQILLLSLCTLYPATLIPSFVMTDTQHALTLKVEAHRKMNQFLNALSTTIHEPTDRVFEEQKHVIVTKINDILARSNKNQKAFTTLVAALNRFLTHNKIISVATPHTIDSSKLELLLNYIETSIPLMEQQEEKNQRAIEQQQVANLRRSQLHKLAIDATIITIGYGYMLVKSEQCSMQ